MVNGLLGTDVPTDQPLMEAGLDSIGALLIDAYTALQCCKILVRLHRTAFCSGYVPLQS